MHKIKPGTLTAGAEESNFKGAIEMFIARDKASSFITSVKGTPACWKQFLYNVGPMVKQLRWEELRWEELPYVTNKLDNLGLSDKNLKNSTY